MAPAKSGAAGAGDYLCSIDHAVLVTADGDSRPIADAPKEFRLDLRAAPASLQSLQRDPPLRQLQYYSEEQPSVVMSIDERLFSGPASELRSEDGVTYVQAGVVFRFLGEGRYTVTGHASSPEEGEGVAVYTGHCMNQ